MPKAGKEKNCHTSQQTTSTRSIYDIAERLGEILIRGFFELLSKFGLGGILTLMLYWFLNSNATELQKQTIIDKWFVMQNGNDVKTMGIVVTLVVLVTLGQWKYYRGRMKAKEEEIMRLNAEKKAYQKALGKRKSTKKGGKK